ncbi:choice-of-anchor X domain-containing protein [Bathymodiolus japonicus methanotrophic gill symbiont]|uniref:choice-of-anchor X domain-containing protein n=1 Tax=Bathymodiolus japonicus methanotrophic gill symbiont TaxID=113269 RepID=UPI001C8D8A44|nr:choice-of-anchor X domain-containing protein [Bathymodiolus japonicus methanotrophic gill symbiont]
MLVTGVPEFREVAWRACTILGNQTVLAPLYTIHPGETFETLFPLIPADKEVTIVLIFMRGVLLYGVIAPDGTVYPNEAPPAGFGQLVEDLPTTRIFKLTLPSDHPERYSGTWHVRVRHDGYYLSYNRKNDSFTHEKSSKPINYAIAVSAGSNLRMFAYVAPQPIYVGDPIQLNVTLVEEGAPVHGTSIDVTPTYPNGSMANIVTLKDDGNHHDGAENDGDYGGVFTQTTQSGGYSFAYHAYGQSARGRGVCT